MKCPFPVGPTSSRLADSTPHGLCAYTILSSIKPPLKAVYNARPAIYPKQAVYSNFEISLSGLSLATGDPPCPEAFAVILGSLKVKLKEHTCASVSSAWHQNYV